MMVSKYRPSATIVPMSNDESWLTKATGMTLHAIALDLQTDPSNFAKKVKRGLTADYILELCEHFELDPIQALITSGKVKQRQEESPEQIAAAIHHLTDKLLNAQATDNVVPLFEQTPDNVGHDSYDLGSVAYSDDEDSLRNWEGDD